VYSSSTLLVDCRVSTVLAFYSSRLLTPPSHTSHLSPLTLTPIPIRLHPIVIVIVIVTARFTSRGVRVAACLAECPRFVCEACASRRSHGVSAETPDLSSQSAPTCCSHRAACAILSPPILLQLAPDPHITIPFSTSTRRSFGALPNTVVADPIRRPSTASRPTSF
jgi:hypothetical protein